MARFMRTEKETEGQVPEVNGDASKADPAPAQEPRAAAQKPRQGSETSFISASLKVIGNLESDAEIQLDGKVEGDVRGKTVTIGEGADISGAVYGETVTVAGTVNGKIEARNVVVSKTARTTGDIIHDSLQIESGAYVDGHCRPEFGKSNGKTVSPKPAGATQSTGVKQADQPAA